MVVKPNPIILDPTKENHGFGPAIYPRPYKPPFVNALTVIMIELTAVLGWLALDAFLPGDMMKLSPGWSVFLYFAPEYVWGVIFAVFFTIGVIGIDASKNWVRLASVAILSTVHFAIAIMIFAGTAAAAGTGFFMIFAGCGFYLLYRHVRRPY